MGISLKYDFEFGWFTLNSVVFERFFGVEVKDKEQVFPLKRKHLIRHIIMNAPHFGRFQQTLLSEKVDHIFIKVEQPVKLQFGIFGDTPYSAGMLIGPVVPLTWKIDPFGVAKFVSHEN